MADAWNGAWGVSWGSSWGSGTVSPGASSSGAFGGGGGFRLATPQGRRKPADYDQIRRQTDAFEDGSASEKQRSLERLDRAIEEAARAVFKDDKKSAPAKATVAAIQKEIGKALASPKAAAQLDTTWLRERVEFMERQLREAEARRAIEDDDEDVLLLLS